MVRSLKVAPPNSLLFISDPDGGKAPDPIRGALILSTPSCISVACLMWQDGETEVTVGSIREVQSSRAAVFEGTLETPNRAVVVSTVEGDTVVRVSVPETRTRVRIWVNRAREPDKVVIGLE
jgi:hypothetical protein